MLFIVIPESPETCFKTTQSCVERALPEIRQDTVEFPFWLTMLVVHAIFLSPSHFSCGTHYKSLTEYITLS
jgi:hypothetical protein